MVKPAAEHGLAAMPAVFLKPVLREHERQSGTACRSDPRENRRLAAVRTQEPAKANNLRGGLSDRDLTETLLLEVRVDVFETESRGRSAPSLLTLKLPAWNGPIDKSDWLASDHERCSWVLQSAALLCVDSAENSLSPDK